MSPVGYELYMPTNSIYSQAGGLTGPFSIRPTLCMLLSSERHPDIHQEIVSNQMLRLKSLVPLESDCHSVYPHPNEIEYQLPLFDNDSRVDLPLIQGLNLPFSFAFLL